MKKRIAVFISVVLVIAVVLSLVSCSTYRLELVSNDDSSISTAVEETTKETTETYDSSQTDEDIDEDSEDETISLEDDDSSSADETSTSETEKVGNETTSKASEETTIAKSNKDIELYVKNDNTWGDAVKNVQVTVQIKNNSDSSYSDWKVTYSPSQSINVDQIWNSDHTESNGKITFNPVQHNRTINSNSIVEFGFILSGTGAVKPSEFTVVAGSKTAEGSANKPAPVQNNQNNNQINQQGKPAVAANALAVPAKSTDDWLSVKGNKIVDKNGKEVWITGVNWFGYNTGTNTFDGLWAADLNTSLQSIADHGFNMIRVPISAELILQWKSGNAPTANFNNATNNYLVGLDSLEIFDYVVGQCRANGVKLMIDIHCANTDSMGHMAPVWYTDKVSEKDYLTALSWMADRYKDDDTIIAFDLKNEPHGKPNETPHAIWNDSKDKNNWKYIAEKAAKAVLDKNPNVLIMVEGIEMYPKNIKTNGNYKSTSVDDYFVTWWGGNLRGVKDYPINLGKYQNKLVYSPHDYGPTVYQQPWFKGNYTFDSLYKDCWRDNWMYIYENKTAPLLIGEWGGFMSEPNITWMTYMRKLIKDNKLNHTFWCFNSNSGDTGGLVKDDFTTWDTEKYNFVKEVLWQKNGKFVGLDHKIPLGKNGITLTNY